MKILATVLLGPGSESVVGEAIASVAKHVDGYILIESGGGDAACQSALDKCYELGKAATTRTYTWTGDYGAARQAALDWARHIEGGCDYALTLDPDERVELHDSFRSHLEAYPEVEVWIVADADTGYFKERVIRTSASVHWHGRVCEFLAGREVAGSKLPGVFRELPKSLDAENRRFARGVVECQRMIDEGDDCYRWRRHLGTCLMGMGRQAEALEQYEKALPLASHADETAWMRYLVCEQYVLADRMPEARALAATGIADHAGFLPEFGWILAYTDMKADRMQNASRWAQLVLNTPPDKTRIGFRGQNCKKGAKQILTALHNATPIGELVECHGIKVATAGLSENMKKVLADGKMETAELGLLTGLLTKDDSVLELGGGCGLLATYCARHAGSVVTVEADPQMVPVISATFQANGVSPKLLVGAVSGSGDDMVLDRKPDFWSTKTLEAWPEAQNTVPGLKLSALLAEHSPTVVVCDIEGAEATLVDTPLPETVRAFMVETHGSSVGKAVDKWLTGQGLSCGQTSGRCKLYLRSANG